MTSRAETSRRRIMAVNSTALRSQSSSLPPVAASRRRGTAVAAAATPRASPKPRRVMGACALLLAGLVVQMRPLTLPILASKPSSSTPHRFMMNSRSTVAADWKSVLADFAESVASIEALRSLVLRPHADVHRRSTLRFEPFEPGLHQSRSETQVVMIARAVELLNFARGRPAILDGELAGADGDESDLRPHRDAPRPRRHAANLRGARFHASTE